MRGHAVPQEHHLHDGGQEALRRRLHADPGGAQGRIRRAQRRGQDHAVPADPRRARARRRRDRGAARARGSAASRRRRRRRATACSTPCWRPTRSAPRCWPRPRRRSDAHRIAEIQHAARRHRRAFGRGAGGGDPARARLRRRRAGAAPARISPAAGGCAWRWPACCSRSPTCCCSTSRRTISISKARSGSRRFSRKYPHTVLVISHDRDLLNRSVGRDPASRPAEADALPGRLRHVRQHAAGAAGAAGLGEEEAGRGARAHAVLRRPLQGQGLEGAAGAEPDQGAGADEADRGDRRGAA